MPTYEYECTICGHQFEEFQKITDKSIKICPKCKGEVRRKISGGAGFLFKGSGFYITDYRSESYKKRAKEEKEISKPKLEKKKSKETSEKKKENNWSLRENLKKEQQKQVFEVSFTNKTVKLRLEKPIKN